MMPPLLKLLILAGLFHGIYILSIFDIYFRSPLISGMDPVQSPQPVIAKRLVLFVADGLRADYFFNDWRLAPYLSSRRGSFGVSHTRVPTESRPGHVAIIAGFYEDVSAVTKGWKLNPVEFDSVFARSRKTWAFGSPDIVPMFALGPGKGKLEAFTYASTKQDYAKDLTELDSWTFSEFEKVFKSNSSDLQQDKIVFFLHLLGIDSQGHAYRPYSKEYKENIRFVDNGIKKAVEMMESFYNNDGKTVYVLTSDHGMSDQGSHGDGNPDNTRTPLLVWGAGVETASHGLGDHDIESMKNWTPLFKDNERKDVRQADIAPLMATLLGLELPLQSVGVLPIKYLGCDEERKSLSFLANLQQILNGYKQKVKQKSQTEPFFKEFGLLSVSKAETEIKSIENLIFNRKYEETNIKIQELIDMILLGNRYYETYDWAFLRSIVVCGYVGWMIYSLLKTYQLYGKKGSYSLLKESNHDLKNTHMTRISHTFVFKVIYAAFSAFVIFILMLKASPLIYYCYLAFPLFFWYSILKSFLGNDITISLSSILKESLVALSYIFALEILVFAYFYRGLLSVLSLLLSVVPYVSQEHIFASANLKKMWTLNFALLSIFTLLPVVKDENLFLINLGGFLLVIVAAGFLFYLKRNSFKNVLFIIQIICFVLTLLIVDWTSYLLAEKKGLPKFNQNALITLQVISIGIPLIFRNYLDAKEKWFSIFLGFASPYCSLTISYELLFYSIFALCMALWVFNEEGTSKKLMKSCDAVREYRNISPTDLKSALLFIFFINMAFFGTGNMASVSSFSLSAVTRFSSVFNPFLMGALLICKLLIPFILLTVTFKLISSINRLPPFSLLLLVLSTSDIMTLNFFFLVKDSGSWLDIGTSISHFIIASVLGLAALLLFATSKIFMGDISYVLSRNENKLT